jgi:CDP-glucose 4,6-dehydratase
MEIGDPKQIEPSFWSGKRVFVTGHTGFKGGWLCLWLHSLGAKVYGYSLLPDAVPNLYKAVDVDSLVCESVIANVCDQVALMAAFQNASPEIVIHMAAQPLVRQSYRDPVETYLTNVMGTVHLLEAIKSTEAVKAAVIVTTDKCYENKEWLWGYRENEPMGGHDPYSSSKGCAELVTSAYIRSYFSGNESRSSIATARAGNVIGGGDWSSDRLIPDAIRAFEKKQALKIRSPKAIRPWQHVLEPLSGYLLLAQKLYQEGVEFSGAWNFGPKTEDACSVKEVVSKFIEQYSPSDRWCQDAESGPHEAHYLRLDSTKATEFLGWRPRWSLEYTIISVAAWYRAHKEGEDMRIFSLDQIKKYQNT